MLLADLEFHLLIILQLHFLDFVEAPRSNVQEPETTETPKWGAAATEVDEEAEEDALPTPTAAPKTWQGIGQFQVSSNISICMQKHSSGTCVSLATRAVCFAVWCQEIDLHSCM